jgi:hypothetical protein
MRIRRNPGEPDQFTMRFNFDELQLLAVAVQRFGRIQAGHIQLFAAEFAEQVEQLFPVAAQSAPLVDVGQGTNRRTWPEHTAELIGGDPHQAVAESNTVRHPVDCTA